MRMQSAATRATDPAPPPECVAVRDLLLDAQAALGSRMSYLTFVHGEPTPGAVGSVGSVADTLYAICSLLIAPRYHEIATLESAVVRVVRQAYGWARETLVALEDRTDAVPALGVAGERLVAHVRRVAASCTGDEMGRRLTDLADAIVATTAKDPEITESDL